MYKNIINSQREELGKKLEENYIERDFELKNLESNLIKIISGPRRCGKSFFAINKLKEKGINFGYVNFDDEKLAEVQNYDDIIDSVKKTYNNPEYVFFDEIQNLPKWELFVNRLQRNGYNLILSGSNSKLLSSELSTHLTGRYSETKMLPFSFKEFLKLGKPEYSASELRETFEDYLVLGGYPEVRLKKIIQTEYLRDLFDSIIYKDIIKRHKIRITKSIDNLSLYLLSNFAGEFSYRNLMKIIDSGSVNTVKKYINYLEESFVFFQINRFSFKLKEQISSNKKIYCIDTGFIKAKGFSFSENRGKLFENIVAIELIRRANLDYSEIYYWKNQQQEEVDFLVKNGLKVTELIQVCLNLDNPKTHKREIRALLKASQETKCDELKILTEDTEQTVTINKDNKTYKIEIVPLYKWMQ